jgi:tetratricopeptide (TPR) repeat protein
MSSKIDRTIERLETALMIRPDDRYQRVQLGRAYHQAKRHADAEAAFQKVLSAEPTSSEALYALGLLRQEQERRDEALDLYRRAVASDGDHIGARKALAEHATERRYFDVAREHYEHLVRLQPREAKILRASAAISSHLERHTEARELLERAFALDESDVESLRQLCATWVVLGNWDRVVGTVLPRVEEPELPIDVVDYLGRAARELGAADVVERAYRVRLGRESNDAASGGLAWALIQRRAYEEALEELKKLTTASLEQWLLRGQALFHLGRWQEAIGALQTALQLAPGDGHAHRWLGLALLQDGQLDQAAIHLRHAVRYLPDSVDSWVGLADALVKLEQHNAALEPLQRAIELEPEQALHHVCLARRHAALGRYDLAEQSLARAVELSPDDGEYWLELGETRCILERYARAEEDLVRASQLLPSSQRALAKLGAARVELSRWEEAIAPLERAIHLDAEDVASRVALARAAIQLGRHTTALSVLEPALGDGDQSSGAHQKSGASPTPKVLELAGQTLFELRRYEDAARVLTRRTVLPDVPAATWVYLGLSHEQLRAYADAEEALSRGVGLEGVNVLGLAGLGRCRLELGAAARAVEPLEALVRLTPQESDAWRVLGKAYAATRTFERAKECLQRTLALSPEDGASHEQLGLVLAELGEREDALRHLRKATQLLPRSPAAWRRIAQLSEEKGDAPEAIAAWRQFLAAEPSERGALGRLADLLYQVNDFTEALAVWRRALRDDADDLEALVGSAATLAQLKRDAEASEVLRQVLRLSPNRDEEALVLGQTLMRLGQYDEALRWLRKGNAARPHADNWQDIADCALRLGMVKDEFEALEACLALDPARGPLWRRLGLIALQLGYRPRGIEALETALSQGQGDNLVQEKLGEALRQSAREARRAGELEDARELLQRASRFQANDATLYAEQSEVAEALEDAAQALECIRRAVILKPEEAAFNLRLAELTLGAGDWQGALGSFQRVTELEPSSFGAWIGVGNAFAKLGKMRAAIDAYRRALGLRDDATEQRSTVARWLAEERAFDEAAGEFERVLRDEPLNLNAARWLGRCRTELRDDDAAAVAWRTVLRKDPDDLEALLGLGSVLWQLGRAGEAKVPLERIFEQLESGELAVVQVEFWELWGLVLYALGEHRLAEPALGRASAETEQRELRTELRKKRIDSLLHLERHSEALGEVDALLQRTPGDAELVQWRARALAGSGQAGDAITALATMVADTAANPDDRKVAAKDLAKLYEDQLTSALLAKDVGQAERASIQLAELWCTWSVGLPVPRLVSALGEIATLASERGERERALSLVLTAQRRLPGEAGLFSLRGRVLEQTGAWAQALEAYAESAAIDASVEALVGQSRALERLGRWRDVQEVLERALASLDVYPNAQAAEETHGRLLMAGAELGEPQRVIEHADRLTQLRSLKVTEWRLLGHALSAVERFADAAEAFQAVLDEEPRDGETRFALAKALRSGGRARAALVPLRQLVKDEPGHWAAWIELARRLRETDDFGAANDAFAKASSLRQDAAAAREWVEVAEKTGDAGALERALRHGSSVLDDGEVTLRWGTVLAELGKRQEAIEILSTLVTRKLDAPLPEQVRHRLASLELEWAKELKAAEPERARFVLARAGERVVTDATLLGDILRALVDLGATAPAIQLCERGLEATVGSVDLALLLGSMAESRGEHARAAAAYERALERHPEHLPTLLAASRQWLAAGEPSKAGRWLERASHLEPNNVEVAALLAQVSSSMGKDEDVLRALDVLLQANPNDVQLHERYMRLLAEGGQHDKVAVAVRRAEVAVGPVPTLLALGASSLYAAGRYAEAVIAAERTLEQAPNSALALKTRGASLIELGDLDKGVESLIQARAAEPTIELGDVLALGLVGRGRRRVERGEFDAATDDFEHALREGAEAIVVLPNLANAARRSKQWARALTAARELVEVQPSAANYGMVGELCLELAQLPEAARAFESMVELEGSGEAYLGLGTAYFRLGDERAESTLQRAVERWQGPEPYELLTHLYERSGQWDALCRVYGALGKHRALSEMELRAWAIAYQNLGDAVSALSVWQQLCDRAPHHEEAHWESGRLALAQSAPSVAVRALESLVELNPHHAHAHGALGRALAQLGRHEQAASALERQLQRAPDPELLRLLADQKTQLGQGTASMEALERVVDLDPTHAPSWRELARLSMQAERHNDAVTAARRAVTLEPTQESKQLLAETLTRFAEYASRRGDNAPCVAALAECLAIEGATLETLGAVLLVSSSVEATELAEKAGTRLTASEPDDARLHVALGRVYASRGAWQPAATSLETAVNLVLGHRHREGAALPRTQPLNGATELLVEWSRYLQQAERLTEAAEVVDRALRLGSGSYEHIRYAANVFQLAAEDLIGRGFAEQALPLLGRAAELTERPAEVAFLTALAHRLCGNQEQAVNAARQCLKVESTHQGAFRLGRDLLSGSKHPTERSPTALLEWFEDHLALVEQVPELSLEYGSLLVNAGEHQEGRRVLSPLAQGGQWRDVATLRLADSYHTTEEWGQEVRLLSEATKRADLEETYLSRLAEGLQRVGRLEEATITFERLWEKSHSVDELMKLAGLQVEGKRYDRANATLGRILSVQPSHLPALRLKAWVSKITQRRPEHIAVLQQLTKHDPQARELEELADLFLEEERPADAERALVEWTALHPNEARAHLRCGLVRAQWGDPLQAIPSLEKALRLDPELGIVKERLADLYREVISRSLAAGQYQEALSHSDHWLVMTPRDPDAQYLRAECLQALGRMLEAVATWRVILGANPGHAPSARMLAAQLVGTGRYDEAESTLTKALGANGDSLELMTTLVQLYVTQRKFEQAEIVANRARKQAPSNIDVLVLLSQIAANTSRSGEAEKYLREALRIDPNHSEANYTLGKLYLALGRVELARAQLATLLKANSPRAEKLAMRLQGVRRD